MKYVARDIVIFALLLTVAGVAEWFMAPWVVHQGLLMATLPLRSPDFTAAGFAQPFVLRFTLTFVLRFMLTFIEVFAAVFCTVAMLGLPLLLVFTLFSATRRLVSVGRG